MRGTKFVVTSLPLLLLLGYFCADSTPFVSDRMRAAAEQSFSDCCKSQSRVLREAVQPQRAVSHDPRA